MARKTETDKQITYQKLLDSASELFIQQGVVCTTLNKIAAHAGMTRVAVYWHFDNKDDIIKSLWEEGAGQLHSELMETLSALEPETALVVFRKTIKGMLDQVLNNTKYTQSLRIMMNCIEFSDAKTPLNHFLTEKMSDYWTGLIEAFGFLRALDLLKSTLSDEALASGLMSYLFGLIHHHLEPCSPINLQQDGQALLDIYLDGVLVAQQPD